MAKKYIDAELLKAEIEKKLLELWELLDTFPDDCKGEGVEKTKNRLRFLQIRRVIRELVKK